LNSIGWQGWIMAIYVLVGGTMLLRMLIGIVLGFHFVRTARPLAEPWTVGCNVRISNTVSTPVTFGSTILLPADCINWDTAKRQAVLSHEKSHIDHRDFVVLLLASLHRAVFWFNPLSWWLLRRLTELSEIISDDAAVAVLRDQHSYAAILLDIAGSARPATGVAMARPHTVRRRIERFLAAAVPAAPITSAGASCWPLPSSRSWLSQQSALSASIFSAPDAGRDFRTRFGTRLDKGTGSGKTPPSPATFYRGPA
jgi:hypothetical protein